MIKDFSFASTPPLHFGAGKLAMLPGAAKQLGSRMLLITGARSFLSSSHGETLQEKFKSEKITVEVYRIDKEPTPEMIDRGVKTFYSFSPDSVVAIGGGSVLDAGKAISAMLPLNAPVKDYLEGVGIKHHPGVKVPFVAVPTTAGTGSESTKNAVISETGVDGYKRSLRHNNFVPSLAIVDPLLTIGCPPGTTGPSGMDAFTQLLESYLSTAANPLTDALAYKGLKCIARSLKTAYADGQDLQARTDMALAAYLSGVTLANAGLGLVHGFAASIGGFFEIPHGVICSALVGPANKVTIRKLRKQNDGRGALRKYAAAGKLFSAEENKTDEYYTDLLLSVIKSLTSAMAIPRLGQYGVTKNDFERIAKITENKNNPIEVGADEMIEVLELAV